MTRDAATPDLSYILDCEAGLRYAASSPAARLEEHGEFDGLDAARKAVDPRDAFGPLDLDPPEPTRASAVAYAAKAYRPATHAIWLNLTNVVQMESMLDLRVGAKPAGVSFRYMLAEMNLYWWPRICDCEWKYTAGTPSVWFAGTANETSMQGRKGDRSAGVMRIKAGQRDYTSVVLNLIHEIGHWHNDLDQRPLDAGRHSYDPYGVMCRSASMRVNGKPAYKKPYEPSQYGGNTQYGLSSSERWCLRNGHYGSPRA